MTVATTQHVLSEDILVRYAERAPIYDRRTAFSLRTLRSREAGYLRMNVPEVL